MKTNEIIQKQFLTFFLAAQEYAVQVLHVKEILEYQAVTRMPNTPNWVRGVFNLRGSVIPVLDLAVKLGLGEAPVTKTTCIVILEVSLQGEAMVIGVIVNAVSQVIDLGEEDIKPTPPFGVGIDTHYFMGVANIGKQLALLIDIDKILSTEELPQIEAMTASAVAEALPETQYHHGDAEARS